mmetsp:Transcript_7767/g.29082  ORF Transcript_7767/g.29082 Transcript_7767/m.29082 type:complete len:95 (-) Transcript_7767:10-294(-)
MANSSPAGGVRMQFGIHAPFTGTVCRFICVSDTTPEWTLTTNDELDSVTMGPENISLNMCTTCGEGRQKNDRKKAPMHEILCHLPHRQHKIRRV